MMARHGPGTRKSASDFLEWASLFSGKYFVMIALYADETGTGGIPKSGKEPSPGFYGFLATTEEWEQFILRWKKMLKKHNDAKYFHFRELDKGYRQKHKDCPFHDWTDDQIDDFIYDMAFVASTGPIPIGGNASEKRLGKEEAYEKALYNFFEDFTLQMDKHFKDEKGQVSFFFSANENQEWIAVLNKTMKEAWRRDKRIAHEYTPIDPKSEHGFPCQAADLLAHVNRQNMEPIYDQDIILPQRILDLVVGRKNYVGDHVFSPLATMDDVAWYNLIQDMRAMKKDFEISKVILGEPKEPFYPILAHPVLIKLVNDWKANHSKHEKRNNRGR
jgi:hypothetical protein